MTGKINEFQVPAEERECLVQLALCNQTVATVRKFKAIDSRSGATVVLNRADAEHLRDCLTGELAANGFDGNCTSNNYGRMSEELIDRFYFVEPK